MADPVTELAKEFLELNNYIVRKETKFYKDKVAKGTASDIDIIAIGRTGISVGGNELKENIVAEVKTGVFDKKEWIDDVYDNKFKHIENPNVSFWQLEKYIPRRELESGNFDKVLFCTATTDTVYNYALTKGIKIVTAGFMIKEIANHFKNSKRWTYYPEWYNYSLIRTIVNYLVFSDTYKDKLKLEDIIWIDPEKKRSKIRNRFVKLNSSFFEKFVWNQTDADVLAKLIIKLAKEGDRLWFKELLQSDSKFWAYLMKN